MITEIDFKVKGEERKKLAYAIVKLRYSVRSSCAAYPGVLTGNTIGSERAYLYPESLPYTSIAPNRNEYR